MFIHMYIFVVDLVLVLKRVNIISRGGWLLESNIQINGIKLNHTHTFKASHDKRAPLPPFFKSSFISFFLLYDFFSRPSQVFHDILFPQVQNLKLIFGASRRAQECAFLKQIMLLSVWTVHAKNTLELADLPRQDLPLLVSGGRHRRRGLRG